MTPSAIKVKLTIVLLIALALAILLAIHAPFMNGPYYWKWPWRRLDGWRYFPVMFAAAAPMAGAFFLFGASRARRIGAIAIVMLSMFAMQLVHIGMTAQPFSLSRIIYFVESPMNTSYYADAIRSADHPLLELLANYPGYMPQFYQHSQEKPPGPILFFRAIVQTMGVSDHTALVAGLIIGLLASFNIPARYVLIRTLTHDRNAAFLGCVWIALCPGLTLHFPMLDQVYPVMSCLLIVTWVHALRTRRFSYAALFGLLLAASCFVVYHFLVLGFFLAIATIAMSMSLLPPQRWRIYLLCVFAAAAIVIFYLLLFLATGFNVVAVYRTALVEQTQHLASMIRPYPRTILFDHTDFALGAGWLPWIFAGIVLCSSQIDRIQRRWAMLCVAQIILLALLGLMQAETARIWLFLLPLLIAAAVPELSRWSRNMQWIVLAAAFFLMCLVGQNLTFMY